MTLSSGTRLGPYEILSPLGAGGMGEVYRARDKKLDRDVAVKVLPQSVAADPDSLARFEREAKAVAALSHQNILAIHDFGNQDGIAYAVMELLEGETLRGKLDAGPLPQKQAVDYALQVAKGLSAAHEKGIVHRDLKPENLFVSRDGHLKILDFGLAKRVEAVAQGQETSAPTGSGHTEPGMVMGTMGYMSPEQVKGFPVDHRSDIFSFGTILYELLSGRKAFKRDTNAETMAAILMREPPEFSESGRNISPSLERIVKHCLEKDRESRFQTARDIAFSLSEQFSPAAAASSAPKVAAPVSPSGFRIAVLPFKCGTADSDVQALADGLSEEIVSGLSRFRYLSVVASGREGQQAGEGDDRASGPGSGTRYVVEGSIRRGGADLRVSAQLVDVRTGARLWSETYRRDLQASGMFSVQDDVAARIVATVADSYGVLVHSIRGASGQKDDADLTPVEWQFQYYAYREQISPSSYAALKSRLERAAERNDRQSDLWACLAQVYVDEYAFGFAGDATSLDRALAAARRAVELDRANQFAMVALAQVHFFRQDLAAFGPAAERAMALNPLNTDAIGILGLQIVHTGEFERGAAIVRRAMELNPNHAGWMHFAPLWQHFHKGEYEQALERANRVDVPGHFWPFLVVASACGHLGRRAEAESAVRDLLALDPDFAAHARSNVGTWHFASGLMEPILDGLRKAGLSIPETGGPSDPPRRIGTVTTGADRAESGTNSGHARAAEGFWVAVMPFKYGGADAELASLAEGVTEGIVNGLSRFSYLRVIARSSISHLDNRAGDVLLASNGLGARYVMEGSLRHAGRKVRLAVQLVDTASGAHLWAEAYDRAFDPEASLELQDELIARTVSTCADRFGVLARNISDAVRGVEPGQLSPYEALMRGFGYHQRLTPVEHAEAREALERAVERAPSNADCWAMLSWIYSHEHAHGFNVRPGSLDRALAAARRAVDIAPSNHLAQQALAVVLFFRKETAGCLSAAERALALNPLDTSNEAMFLLAFTGDWDRGGALIRRAMELNPHHPRWYGVVVGIDGYRRGNYRTTVDEVLKANAPDLFWTGILLAAAYGQLGELTAARDALRDLLAQKDDFARSAGQLLARWFGAELVGHLMEGLRKAGLEGAPENSGGAPAPESSKSPAPISGAVRADEGFWVAVLPFKYSGANPELAALVEGLTEDIVTGLSRFSYLRVIARNSTAKYSSESGDVRAIGKELGARYVMEGSIRQAGPRLRLAVQLVDAMSGAHLWAENYERPFHPEAIFELQDELVPRIVSTVADMHGVLPRSMGETVRGRTPEQLSPYEAVLRSFGYFERATIEELAAARSGLESAVRKAPAYAEAWAMLSILCTHEYGQAFDLRPDSLTTGSAAARRAVEAAPSSHLAWFSLAQALFFQKEFQSFRNAAERAVLLNPMDGDSIATLGGMLACSGDLERGLVLAGRAKQLNPHHPGWYWWVDFCNAYRQREYRGALGFALKMNLPRHWFMHAATSAAYGQLGEGAAASKALQNLLEIRPDFAATVRMNIEKWWEPDFVDHLMDGWRKAGLEMAPARASASPSDSGAVRAEEGFWVAVLPFKYGGGDTSLTALAEGLSEEIVTGLSRFSYLRVIARDAAVSGRSGKELGARYVMEGTLRQAGTKLRLAVQLVDAVTGAHLWAENYERTFSPEAVFELQDDLAPRIVSMVAGMNGVLPRSMSEALRGRTPEQLSPYGAVLRSFGYLERVTPEELAVSRSGLELAVGKAPDYGDAWAMLALLCLQDYGQGFNLQPDSLARGAAAARRAVEAAPASPLASFSLAQALYFQKEFETFRNVAERAAALNPMDGNSIAFLGELLTYAGESERGLALAGRAKQLNPNHPGWYWYADYYDAYRRGDDDGALRFALKINLPSHWPSHAAIAAACGQLGQVDAAGKALKGLLKLRPDFATTARSDFEKWFEPEYVERAIDGLRKAGLEIPDDPARPGASPDTMSSGAARAEEGFWVAVLPFKYAGASAELKALADGLSEEVVTGLSRFSYLRVIARASTARYSSESGDIRAIGKELGARYVMEGSIRQAGSTLRISAQLVDAGSGAHLWAETYPRSFRPEENFELQDDLASRIVSTVADMNGILPHTMSEVLRERRPDELSPYETVLRSFGYMERLDAEEHAVVRSALERAVQAAPGNADCLAMLSMLYSEEHKHGFNARPDPLGRALEAARRAVQAAPSNHLAHHALAQVLFFRRELRGFLGAAERAVALNRMDGCTASYMGILRAYAGDWEHGIALAEAAMQLNPNFPGWYWFGSLNDAMRRRDFRGALDVALKMNLPSYYHTHVALATSYGHLGDRESAGRALRDLLALKPGYGPIAREDLAKWLGESELLEIYMDGLQRAGLDVGAGAVPGPKTAADGTVAIAVLPFSDLSAAKDQEYLCEGMAEEIMNALVGIEGIRVASRTSTFQARRQGADLPAIGKLLSVGHVLEGGVRTSGDRLRVTAQLTDVASGFQLWSERFDRTVEDVFAVQDEIASGVVDAVKARLSSGEHAVPARPAPTNLEAYRSYLKGRHLRYAKEDYFGAIRAYEEAIRLDPTHAPSWNGLAEANALAANLGMIPAREACSAAKQALATAVRLEGESADSLHGEAFVALIERRWSAMEAAWRRAIELQPTHVQALGSFGISLCIRQKPDEGFRFLGRAREADPLASFPCMLTGWALLCSGKPREARRYAEDALAFEKEDTSALLCSIMAKVALGEFEEGITTAEHLVAVTRRGASFLGVLGWALATAGRNDEARALLEELRERPASPAVVSEAWLLAALGEIDAAFEVLARTEDEYQALLYYTGLPGFDSLRWDPRFGALLERLGLPREQG